MFDFKPEDGDGSMAIEDSSGYANQKWFLFIFEGEDTQNLSMVFHTISIILETG